ncbi:SPOR domain-containing protein, partial [bacterium]|nr:SPOR domain-containing protein [bacterium]
LLVDWMLAAETDPQYAIRLRRELEHRFSRSLPAALVAEQELRLEELQRSLEAPSASAHDSTPFGEESPAPATASGRYALQFAAFADRARALKFLDDWRERLPGLLISEVTDERGLTLYKLRAGSYPGMSQARDQAALLRASYDLDPLPVKADDSP